MGFIFCAGNGFGGYRAGIFRLFAWRIVRALDSVCKCDGLVMGLAVIKRKVFNPVQAIFI